MHSNRVVQGRRGRGRIATLLLVGGTALMAIYVLLHTSRSALQGYLQSTREAVASAASRGIHQTHRISMIQPCKHNNETTQHQISSIQSSAPALHVLVLSGQPWYTLYKDSAPRGASSSSRASVRLPLILHSSNFQAVVRHHVDPTSGAVAISTFRGGIKPLELSFAMNQYVQFAGVGLVTNLMVICTTYVTAVNAWRHNVPLYLNNLTVKGRPASPDPVITKWFLAAEVAKLGHAVLFVDFDLGLRCNPYTLFQPAASGTDIEILWDKYYYGSDTAVCTNGAVSVVAGKQFSGHCASTGFWFVHSHDLVAGARLAQFLQAMYEQSLSQWEQLVFNIMAPEWDTLTASQQRTHSVEDDGKVSHLMLVILTYPGFVNILNLPHLTKVHGLKNSDVCMLHCGAISNGEPKAAELEKLGLFKPQLFRNSGRPDIAGDLTLALGAVQLEGYGTDVVIPYFDPSRLDTIWL